MHVDLQRLAKHSGLYFIGNIINRVGAFLLLPLYTNYLSVADYGVLEILYSMTALVAGLLSVGLAHTVLRFYFEYDSDEDRHAVISTTLVIAALLSLAGVAVLMYWSGPLSAWLFNNGQFLGIFYIGLAIVVLEISTEIGNAFIRARELSTFYVVISFTKLIVQVAFSICFVVLLDMNVYGVAWANLFSIAIAWLVVTAYMVRHCGLRVDLHKLWPLIQYAVPFGLSGIVGILMFNIDRFILKDFVSMEAVGIYGLAMKFALLLNILLADPFQRSYGPFRFSIMKRGGAAHIQAEITRYFSAGVVLVGLGITLFVHDLLRVMSDPAYWKAAELVPFLILGMASTAVSYCFQTSILYEKKTTYVLSVSLVVLGVNVVANIILVPLFNVYGAALAFLIARFADAVITDRVAQGLYPVDYDYYTMALMLVGAGAAYAFVSMFAPEDIVGSVGFRVLVIVVFCGALYRLDSGIRSAVSKGVTLLWQRFAQP